MKNAKEPRRYVTQHILEEALRAKRMDELAYKVQISPRMMLIFGHGGVSLKKCFRRSTDYKWVNDWYNLSVDEINQALANQEWEVYE